MTTFQDPPPSRRAVRQSERGEAEQVSYPPFTPRPEVTDQEQREMWDTAQRRVPQLPPVGEAPAAPVSGRRAAVPQQQPEPLTYSTQGRPEVPSYDGPFRNSAEPQSSQPDDLPPTQALPKQDQPAYRVRDYAPAPAEPAPLDYHTAARVPQAETPTVHAVPDQLVEPPPHTLTRRELRALQQRQAAAADAPVERPTFSTTEVEQPAAPAQAVQAPVAPEPAAPEPVIAEPIATAEQAQSEVAQPEAVRSDPVAAPVQPFSAVAPIDATEEKPWPFAFGAPSAPEVVEESVRSEEPAAEAPPVRPLPAQVSAIQMPPVEQAPIDVPSPVTPADGARALFGDIMTPISQPIAPIAPEAQPSAALDAAMAEYDALAARDTAVPPAPAESVAPAQPVAPAEPVASVQPDVPAEPVSAVEPVTPGPATSRPFGHWSTQLDLDDETQPFENTLSRRVGGGQPATNALVLPVTPERDIRGALTGTGEIMLTGSIDLPASLGATGTTDRHDHGGLDALFDTSEHELSPTDSQPVRAVRAVSTHATGQAVTHTQKPKGTKVLNVLLFSAVGMAVVGVGLLVTVVLMNVL